MSWYDSIVSGIGNLFSGDSGGKVIQALVNGGVSAYNAYNKNDALDDYMNLLQGSSVEAEAEFADYQNYLNELAKWQAENPNYGKSYKSYPYMGQLQSAIKGLQPYNNMTKKTTKKQHKVFRNSLNDLQDLDVTQSKGTPHYALNTGIGDMIKKKGA